MEQGQVLDKGQRLRCGHLVARGRRVFVRQNHGGEDVQVCWDCMADKTLTTLRPLDHAVVNMDKAVFKMDRLEALIFADKIEVERREAAKSLARLREWLGQWP